jgi:ABC-type transport system involved in multi-copper enzyme maturation permease subunit
MLVTTFVVFFAGQALIGSGGAIATASVGNPDVLRTLIGTAGYLTGVALIGLAAGTLLRSTAGAISTLVAVVFLLPGLGAVLLPTSWQDNVLKYLPSNAGSAFTSVTPPHGMLSPTAGLLVFLAWIVVPLVAAAIAIKRRPA